MLIFIFRVGLVIGIGDIGYRLRAQEEIRLLIFEAQLFKSINFLKFHFYWGPLNQCMCSVCFLKLLNVCTVTDFRFNYLMLTH